MKKVLILCLMLAIAFSFSCAKKQKEAEQTTPPTQEIGQAGMQSPTFDVVSKEELDPATAQFSYTYNNVIYYFTSAENMEAFKANPEKYIAPAPAPAESTQTQ